MAKSKTEYVCTQCQHTTLKWQGQCPSCKAWNTMEENEVRVVGAIVNSKVKNIGGGKTFKMSEIDMTDYERMSTGFDEFDRVLGGGLVDGELVLMTGDPGIGKSTLLLQSSYNIAENKFDGDVLYVSGEESLKQVRIRAERLNCVSDRIVLMSETNISNVEKAILDSRPKFVIVDSIQTMLDPETKGAATGVAQIKACTSILMDLANNTGIPIVLVGHVTKDGELAGPKNLEHMVDCVLYFEGDRQNTIRILRTEKNRFGNTDEVGIFEMGSEGLFEKENPSELFMSDGDVYAGSAIVVTVEGTRPIMAEIQALVVPTIYNYPKRMATGIDNSKLTLICASLERKVGVPLGKYDVYVRSVGGLKFSETSIDLAVSLAIVSSLKDEALPDKTVVLGEVGLVGEVRKVPFLDKRVKEAVRLGWKNIIIPNQELSDEQGEDVKITCVRTVQQAINAVKLNG